MRPSCDKKPTCRLVRSAICYNVVCLWSKVRIQNSKRAEQMDSVMFVARFRPIKRRSPFPRNPARDKRIADEDGKRVSSPKMLQNKGKKTMAGFSRSRSIGICYLRIVSLERLMHTPSNTYLEYSPRVILIISDTPVALAPLHHNRWLQSRVGDRVGRAAWWLLTVPSTQVVAMLLLNRAPPAAP